MSPLLLVEVNKVRIEVTALDTRIDILTDEVRTIKEENNKLHGLLDRANSRETVNYGIMDLSYSNQDDNKDLEFLGEWRITAYCSCEKCCGKWASSKYRPDGIVRGASGEQLIPGVSVAAPASLVFGTSIEIDGLGEYIVHDRMAQWVIKKHGNTIDLYMEDHKEALEFGVRILTVYSLQAEGGGDV